jgi:cytochrome c oxidase cbb3-type subunit 4
MSPDMTADTGILRGIVAAVLLVAFVGLWVWCYSARRRPMYEAAAQLPLEDDIYRVPACCRGGGSRDALTGQADEELRGATR